MNDVDDALRREGGRTGPDIVRRSLWWRLRDPRGWGVRQPEVPAELPTHTEVLIVGAGLTGLVTAVLLGRAGRAPLVVEAREAGSGTTGSSTAKA